MGAIAVDSAVEDADDGNHEATVNLRLEKATSASNWKRPSKYLWVWVRVVVTGRSQIGRVGARRWHRPMTA